MSGPRQPSGRGRVLVVTTVAILLLPWGVGPPWEPVASRAVAPPPDHWTSLGQTQTYEAIEAWLSGRVRIRPWARGLVANASYFALGQSSSPQVVAGRDGWLFFRGDFTTSCGFSPAAFEADLLTLTDRLEAAARKGGRTLVFVVVPDKTVGEPARLGPWGSDALAQCSVPFREILQRVSAARPMLAYIAPEAIVRWGAGVSWTPGDSHWTPLASRALLEAVLERLGDSEQDVRRTVESAARPGAPHYPNDLYRLMELLGSRKREAVPSLVGTSETTVEEAGTRTSGPNRRWTTRNPLRTAEREVVVIGDSFGELPFPSIAATWGCGTWAIWDFAIWDSLAATADFVVLQSVQRAVRRRVAQFLRPESAKFWAWLSTPAPAGPARACDRSPGS